MPGKQGIHYFPFDLTLIGDRKFRKLRSRHGAISVLVYIALLVMIYRDKGYYLDYNEQTKVDVLWELSGDLRGKNSPSEEEVSQIIAELVRADFFDTHLYHKGKLTSRDIQETFYKITTQRKYVEVDFSIWLLNEEEMRALSGRSLILENYLTKGIHVKREENHVNFGQRKEKESKEKDRKGNGAAYADLILPYGHVRILLKEYEELVDVHGEKTVQRAAEKLDEYMEMTGKHYNNCALAIKKWALNAAKGIAPAKKTGLHNYEEPDIDYDKIQRMLRNKQIGEMK